MSTQLSLATPETGSFAAVPMTLPSVTVPAAATSGSTASTTTEQVATWSILGLVSAAACAGVLEVIMHLIG